jgi:WhiB family redox-sensing transcriptional regulator
VIAERSGQVWYLKALCRGPQAAVFFPPTQPEGKEERLDREAAAKSMCALCPVQRPCLDYAIRIREPHGIWGGLSEVERKQILERRAG